MFEVTIEFFERTTGKFAGIMRTALPYYFYNGEDVIDYLPSAELRKIVPGLPVDVHYLVRVAE